MIIYIDKTIGEHLKTEQLTEDEQALFLELAMSRRNGKNILLGDRESLSMLVEQVEGLPGRIFDKILGRATEDRSIIEKVDQVVVLSYEKTPKAPDFVTQRALPVNIAQAIGFDLASQCCLVGENYGDCKFYIGMGYRYCEEQRIGNPRIVFGNVLGGGDTTDEALEECVTADKRLTLCISDSDYTRDPELKAAPPLEKGDTAQAVEEKAEELKNRGYFLFDVYILRAHEIENLIPFEQLERVKESDSNIKKGVEFLKRLLEIQNGKPILYYDFKKGFPSFKDPESESYWKSIMEQVKDAPKNTDGTFQYPALGRKILRLVKDNMSENDNEGYKTTRLDPYLKELWEKIGRLVYTWGCAQEKIVG